MVLNLKLNDTSTAINTDPKTGTNASSRDTFIWDKEVPQLAQRLRGANHTWVMQTRREGKTVRRKIGDVANISVAAARAQARVIVEQLVQKAAPPDPNTTLKDFAERFLADCQHQWKPATLKAHARCMRVHIVPVLGTMRVAALRRQDVLKWRRGLIGSAGTGNRVLAVLSGLMRHAELLGLRRPGENPCAGLRRHQSDFKAEYLDADGYKRLNDVLCAQANAFPQAVACIRFILFTGCRKGEAKAARWDQHDGPRISLPDAKAGPKSLWMGKPVRNLLASLPRTGSAIFAGDNPKGLEVELSQLWKIVRRDLKRPKLRIHDLRHSFASVAVR
ncbi:site-specific recombinase, phage integrase family protein [Rhodobacterales bacterium HTCC2150]|nr:site-specific recombinase, phage integrase family protein [Rhodobacterales bacterium HTCC2150] [Rhodobacteraceae bacterium HTCC2150]